MTKKNFKDNINNPAIGFISQESINKAEQIPTEAPEGYKINPLYIETKSKRLQLLIQPSIHAKLKKKAKAEDRSVNDIVNTIIIEALKKEE